MALDATSFGRDWTKRVRPTSLLFALRRIPTKKPFPSLTSWFTQNLNQQHSFIHSSPKSLYVRILCRSSRA
jgi:hypothetical protein